jgi:beta-glucanase (GH16 family)
MRNAALRAPGMAGAALVAISLAAAGVPAAAAARTTGPGSSAVTAGIHWGKPVLVENFNGTTLNRRRWFPYDDQTAGPRRVPQAVHVRDGHLELVGQVDKSLGFISGAVGSTGAYAQTYGRWVVRFRAGRGSGYAPTVLLWPQDNNWAEGEMDMAEITNPDRAGAQEFMHGPHHNRVGAYELNADFTKWHVLAIDWLPDRITTWLDGRRQWTVRRSHDPSTNIIPGTPFRLALQNDPGCDGTCHRTESTPRYVIMYVDWVRIYRLPAA